MIVDDNFINRESLKKVLGPLNEIFDLQIIESDDGDKAVEVFKSYNFLKNKQNIQIIFMDLNMGKMNGDIATK